MMQKPLFHFLSPLHYHTAPEVFYHDIFFDEKICYFDQWKLAHIYINNGFTQTEYKNNCWNIQMRSITFEDQAWN